MKQECEDAMSYKDIHPQHMAPYCAWEEAGLNLLSIQVEHLFLLNLKRIDHCVNVEWHFLHLQLANGGQINTEIKVP